MHGVISLPDVRRHMIIIYEFLWLKQFGSHKHVLFSNLCFNEAHDKGTAL